MTSKNFCKLHSLNLLAFEVAIINYGVFEKLDIYTLLHYRYTQELMKLGEGRLPPLLLPIIISSKLHVRAHMMLQKPGISKYLYFMYL